MHYLDLTLSQPEENLACDEALLDACEEDNLPPVLRFWEPDRSFVVLGYGNKIQTEVNVAFCERNSIPILRRCTGGGTVLLGPGCLNYTLILPTDPESSLHNVSAANRYIMEKQRAGLSGLLSEAIQIQGYTDLSLNGLKFSGNSQRRKKSFLLFHGTFLLRMDLSLIEKTLAFPSKQPEYRKSRSHIDFLTNINLPADKIKAALRRSWQAVTPVEHFPETRLALCREKYKLDSWNRKF
jgi:lipoate-protein ligase A